MIAIMSSLSVFLDRNNALTCSQIANLSIFRIGLESVWRTDKSLENNPICTGDGGMHLFERVMLPFETK